MFRRVLNLILSIAAALNLNLDPEAVRQAILSGLKALAAAAAATPTAWDDMVIRLAIAFVESSAWEMIWKKITDYFAPKAWEEVSKITIPADEMALMAAFERVKAA